MTENKTKPEDQSRAAHALEEARWPKPFRQETKANLEQGGLKERKAGPRKDGLGA